LIHDLRRKRDELGIGAPPADGVVAAFTELARAI
jgi:hypothetical protein